MRLPLLLTPVFRQQQVPAVLPSRTQDTIREFCDKSARVLYHILRSTLAHRAPDRLIQTFGGQPRFQTRMAYRSTQSYRPLRQCHHGSGPRLYSPQGSLSRRLL